MVIRPIEIARLAPRRFAAAIVVGLQAMPRLAWTQPPDPQLMAKLAHHSEVFQRLMEDSGFAFETLIQHFDSDGKVSGIKTKLGRVEHDAQGGREKVIRCIEDGKDITADEQQRSTKRDAERAEQRRKHKEEDDDLRPPFLPSEQPKYLFDQVAVDPADPTRIQLAFAPRHADSSSMEGTAWVSTATGTVLSLTGKLSKPPLFVDWMRFSVEFEATSPLGPVPSKFILEGRGGLLFIHQHLRGEMKMSDFLVAP